MCSYDKKKRVVLKVKDQTKVAVPQHPVAMYPCSF